jgi:hypothetical protein
LAQVGKEQIQFGLNALAHTTKHKANQGRQRQLAVARKGAGMIGMSCHLVEGGRMQMRNEPGQEF